MSVDPIIEFAPTEEIDHDPEINPATDYIIQCPRCGEYRHKSWFRVNWSACAACMQFEKLFLDNLTFDLAMADPAGVSPQFKPAPTAINDLKLRPLSTNFQRPRKRKR